MNRYYWSGISNDVRIKAISDITDCINSYASILSFQRFSDLSLNLVLETEECRLNDFQNSLKKILSLEVNDANPADSKADCLVLLNITFTQGSGDLEIEVPDIPE